MARELDSINISELEKLVYIEGISLSIKNLIGKGGQKHVYYSVLTDNSSPVVLKILVPSNDTLERVKREIRATTLIDHPNVPKILYTNITQENDPVDLIWIIEEFIEGQSLRSLLKKGKRFSIIEIISYFDTMLSILSKSETLNIVHRDIKPDNIMIDSNGKFRLIDFGISRHLDLDSITSTAAPMGPQTLGYSAAEQFRNRKKDIDIRADFFSLGVVAAEMIIGQNPYWQDTHNPLQLMKKIEQQPLPILRIDGDSQYFLARFIKTMGDNRTSRRPKNVETATRIFNLVKQSIG